VIVALVGLVLLVPLLGMCGIGLQGEPDTPSGSHVINHTSTRLDIVQLVSDGSEVVKLQLEPGQEMDSQIPCGSVPLEARTPSGELVASRGPFDECHDEPWVISPPDEDGTVAPDGTS
jgi:hypothetical protein